MSAALLRARKNKARAHALAGEWQAAERILRELTNTNARDAEAWFLLAALYGQGGRHDDAIACGRRAVSLVPAYADAHYNLGQAYMHARRYAEAAEAYREVLRLNPKRADVQNSLGLALDSQGLPHEAFQCYQEAVRLDPGLADGWHNGGNASLVLGYPTEGIRYLRRAVALRPAFFASHVHLGFAYLDIGELDAAHDAFEQARSLDPANADPIMGEAAILEKRGDFKAAWNLIRPFHEAGCRTGRFVTALAVIAPHVGRRREAISVLEDLNREAESSGATGSGLHLTLGNLYDQEQDYDRAFPHFARANALAALGVRDDMYLTEMSELQEVFTAEFIARAPRATITTGRPIFIVGMPRSGTTLAEQIVASHPDVCAGGELTEIADIAQSFVVPAGATRHYSRFLAQASPSLLRACARRYLDRLDAISRDAPRVTDKMPHNFLHLGLIALLFPRARVVHCRRNALDNCFSIFTHEFSTMHGYATDLRALGMHYCAYARLMRHWGEMLPAPVFELPYETLVAEQERVTRDLLAFLDLPWDDRCLRFHESKRLVNTPSYDQVRRPLYRTSVARWQHYRKFLGPLVEVLRTEPGLVPENE